MGKSYSVLWIDDQCDDLEAFVTNAEQENIWITPFKTAKDGLTSLKDDLEMWDAVILDGKFWLESEDEKADIDALFYIKDELVKLQSKRIIPWFVYTGQPDLMSDTTFSKWLKGKRYYAKAKAGKEGDEDQLFADIKEEADKSENTQLKHNYRNVFGVIKGIDSELLSILKGLVPEENRNADYFNKIRKILDAIMDFLVDNGILAIPRNGDKLTSCSIDLGHNENVPVYIQRCVHSAVAICNEGSHRESIDSDVKSGKASYLVRSTIYELLDIILWCGTL